MPGKVVALIAKDRIERSEHDLLQRKLVAELSQRKDVVVLLTPHLYDLAMDGPGVQLLRAIPCDLIVLAWLYPRAVYWLLDAHRVRGRLGPTSSLPEEDSDRSGGRRATGDGTERTIWCFDLRRYAKAEPLLQEIGPILASPHPASDLAGLLDTNGQVHVLDEQPRRRWYPVVDYQRCNHCLECLNFCLFGVFSLDVHDAVIVQQPDACRPGCPACSRICPEGAIMFPQHKEPGIAGDPEASRSALKLDLSQLFGGRTPAEQAAAERDRALAEQAADLTEPSPHDQLDQLVDDLDEMDL